MKTNKKVPFPQIVSGDSNWKVFQDSERPRTSNLSKEMYVPFGDACDDCGHYHDKNIRRHELAHVKWSPATMGKLGPDESEITVEAIEEIRIHYLLAQREMCISDWVICPDKAEKLALTMIYEKSPFIILLYLLSMSWNMHDMKNSNGYYKSIPDGLELDQFKDIWDAIKSAGTLTQLRIYQINWCIAQASHFYQRLIRKRRNSYSTDIYYKPSYRKTRQVAKELHALMEDFNNEPKPEEVMEHLRQEAMSAKEKAEAMANMESGKEGEGEDGEGEGKELTLEARQFGTMTEIHRRTEGKQLPMDYKNSPGYEGRWGDMKIINAPLEVNLNGQIKRGREYRPMDFGTNPKYINRYCIDKKIFKQRQRTYGGTVLIDASGSMSFSGQDILEIMEEVPAVTIAMYNHTSWSDGATGTLRIIAKDGKRVTEEYLSEHSGGGNLVDGPALEWLAKMPPARIWVSDMYVFGRHNSNEINLLQEGVQICKRNNILRLANIEEVKQFALEINKI